VSRRSIGQGIYQDAHGISVVARIGSGAQLKTSPPVRFPLVDGDGVPYSRRNNRELVACYLRLRAALEDERRSAGGAGSIGVAIETFLADHPIVRGARDASRCRDLKSLLAPWRTSAIAPLAVTTPVPTLRPAIAAVLEAWRKTRAASTVRKRKEALADVLRPLIRADADGVQNLPTDHIKSGKDTRRAPRGVDLAIVARILAAIPDVGRAKPGEKRPRYSENKIRLRVMAWTGLTRIALVRLTRERVDFANGKIYYPPREKGAGAPGLWVTLLPPALEALRDYDAARLWQTDPARSSQHSAWRRAVATTRAELVAAAANEDDPAGVAHRMLEQFTVAVPANCHPYDLRHSFATDTVLRSGDVYAAKEILQHADIKTTEHYIGAAVSPRVAAAIEKMRAFWFPESPKPGAVVRDFHVVSKTGA
jgi:integrase